MALTDFQRAVCRLLADQRVASGESYVAGGSALNEMLAASRVSRDLDLFHDTEEALEATWAADRRILQDHGFDLRVLRERPAFVEAEVGKDGDRVLVEWARDSAFRFFPLVQHPDVGLALHPFDLATNKVLALVGRLEVRDWVDLVQAGERIQPLGYLAWAACGKDPGFSPMGILDEAARTARYSADEVAALAFAGPPSGRRRPLAPVACPAGGGAGGCRNPAARRRPPRRAGWQRGPVEGRRPRPPGRPRPRPAPLPRRADPQGAAPAQGRVLSPSAGARSAAMRGRARRGR